MNREEDRSLKSGLRSFLAVARSIDSQVLIVFMSTAILTTVSYYFTSRRFFRATFASYFFGDPLLQLYEYCYWFIGDFAVYFIVVLFLILFVHKKPLRDFGLGIGDWKFGLKMSVVFFLVMLPILWIASASADFQTTYPHAQIAKADWNVFFIYELVFLIYFVGWEFIWRGYMLFGLEKQLGGAVAVLVQMIPFVILHNGKPVMETFGAIVAAIALGALTLRTRSFWYCVVTHWSVMITIDFLSTIRIRTNIFGIAPSDLMEIFSRLLR